LWKVGTSIDNHEHDEAVIRRRIALADCYAALPYPASPAFWRCLEAVDTPLELLVRCLRDVAVCKDDNIRQRILQIIVQRTQALNEYWARNILKQMALSPDERFALMCDLCADLYEQMLRALLDPRRLFWEENFLHCLSFERKHVYRSFMMREGRWFDQRVSKGDRVPRALVLRLDQPVTLTDGESYLLDLEDEQAQIMLQAIDSSDLLRLVLHLPERLKTVVLLLYWGGRSEKDIAHLLNISDRTVRNRMQEALKILRGFLIDQMEDE
jgi:RNA polymerase sigma factor (sigma-70 family)